jgi:P27 family predicted phage terminase small subunit
MRGRKPKPPEQRAREGNAGNRPLPAPLELSGKVENARRALEELPPPADLPRAALELWNDVVPILGAAGVLNRVDRAALTALCIQWHRAEQARKALKAEGIFTTGSTGQIVEHPALGIERTAHQLFVRFAEQFGITPVARARIAAAAAVAGATMREELANEFDLDLD